MAYAFFNRATHGQSHSLVFTFLSFIRDALLRVRRTPNNRKNNISVLCCSSGLLHAVARFTAETDSYLFVHEHVDDWVVDCCCLGKEGGYGSQPGVQDNGWMSCDQYREGCVRRPAHHERHDHHHHHTGHLPLGLPGSGQTAVRYLEERNRDWLWVHSERMFSLSHRFEPVKQLFPYTPD